MHLQPFPTHPTRSGTRTATLGEFSASNAALLRLQSALCQIPRATIPESHAGHLGVLAKTFTSGIDSAGEVAGDVGTTEGDLDATRKLSKPSSAMFGQSVLAGLPDSQREALKHVLCIQV